MADTDNDPVIPRGGTAVVVVAGVGHDQPGDTVGSITGAMIRVAGERAGATPFVRRIVVPAGQGSKSPETTYDAHCALVRRPDAGRDERMVVWEMHWADLSRFPETLRGFVLTLYGLLFQVGTIGMESLRAIGYTPWRKFLIRGVSFMTVVVVPALTAAAAILGISLGALLRLDSRSEQAAVIVVTALVAGGLAFYGDRYLRAHGWRFSEVPLGAGRPGVAYALIALGVGLGPAGWAAQEGLSLALGTHEVLWFTVRWVLPAAWAIVGALAIGLVLTHMNTTDGALGRAYRTGVLSVVVGGLGIALLGALLVAAALAVVSRLVGANEKVPCEAVADITSERLPCTFATYSDQVFAWSLRPLGTVLLCAVALILVAVAAGLFYVSALAARGGARRPEVPGAWHLIDIAAVGAIAVGAFIADAGWSDLFGIVAAVTATGWLAWWWSRRVGPGGNRQPVRRGFDGLLRYLGNDGHVRLLWLALVLASAALVAALWTDGGVLLAPADALLGGLAGAASGTDATGLTAALLAAGLIALVGLLAKRLSSAARGLDVAYDVATYLRTTHGDSTSGVEPPRRRVLRRYAALIRHIRATQGPERIVFVAHSQGSMYTLALLFRDHARDAADVREDGSGWAVAPGRLAPRYGDAERGLSLPDDVRLVTAGCPVLQTYSPNFPGQYEWPQKQVYVRWRMRRAGVGVWRNVYRSGDYFGRALFGGQTCDGSVRNGPLQQVCIGPGHHTGYWGDPKFAEEVLAVIDSE